MKTIESVLEFQIDVFQGNIIIEQCACFTACDPVHDWRSRNQPQKEKIGAITAHFQAHRPDARAQEL